MQTRRLGESDLEVSAVALGCWALVGGFNWGPQDRQESRATLRAAHELGVTLFDTAEAYGDGESERLIGEALGNVRDEILLASKVSPSHFAAPDLTAACEESLRNLGTDRLDLYQLHWPTAEVPPAETVGALERLREAGKIRHWGVSNYGPRNLDGLLPHGRPVSNQVAYNLLFRAVEHAILPRCREEGIGVLCYSPIMQGLLAGKFADADAVPDDRARTRHFAGSRPQARHGEAGAEAETFAAVARVRQLADEAGVPMADLALAWLLAREGVSSVIAGARRPEQVEMNARAAALELPADLLARLDEATRPLKEALGPNPDMWQGESRIR
jgi:aryl-alcohol dehydrogenase-like predicted oxidoreductase